MTVLAFVIVLAGLGVLVVCAARGAIELFMVASRKPATNGYPPLIHASVQLGAAAALALSPFVAAWWAEQSTGWTDPDGDGMLDDFANGGYDYMDVVGDSLIHTWGLMTVLIVTALFLTLRSISDRPPDSERSGSS